MTPNKQESKDKQLLALCKELLALRPTPSKTRKRLTRGWRRTMVITHQFSDSQEYESYAKAFKLVAAFQTSTDKHNWPSYFTLNSISYNTYKALPEEVKEWFTYNGEGYHLRNVSKWLTLKVIPNRVEQDTSNLSAYYSAKKELEHEIQKLGGWERYNRLIGQKKHLPKIPRKKYTLTDEDLD